MTSNEIREKFLKYFESKGHLRVRSAPLIPANDPTLYFTNAGMVQFKEFFTGVRKPSSPRATSSQKCLRVSGKHNDLENVGRTARHHTFFEMLGNFSFGDYFKKEAIRYGWEFLAEVMKIPKERLWITVYEKDDEAERLWMKEVGVPKNRILRLQEKDNFWSMGETGPCGPCSEIHYDHGEKYGCGKKICTVGCDCDRFMEIWNLVFMQYERGADGSMRPLPKPSIDTGMGLERLAAVVQGVHSNYDSDLFTPLIREIARLSGKEYGSSEEINVSIRVLADHIRATAFLIADGVHPSNEGRGYVLRRIMRRAIRHAKLLGQERPFFYRLVSRVVEEMKTAYPELPKEQKGIERVIEAEEVKFLETLDIGLGIIESELQKVKQNRDQNLHGDIVFKLYDTFGFPIDLTELIAQEHGVDVDLSGFENRMEEQRRRGRKAWKGSTKSSGDLYQDVLKGNESSFVGYDRLEASSKVAALLKDGKRVTSAVKGDEIDLLVLETPFYPEGGGQVGDAGTISAKNLQAQVLDTQKVSGELILHHLRLEEGGLKEGDEVTLSVNKGHREGSMRHHSATHLLHSALREILGTHVRQAGSLVTPDRLRFDFSHFEAIPQASFQEIEELVNRKIVENLKVTHETLPYDEAIKKGALAFFEEKYGDRVRVISMGDFSIEFCGGTHVRETGQIKLLKLTGESSVAAGIRRVEAVVGDSALKKMREMENQITRIARVLKVSPAQVAERIEKLVDQVKRLEKELEDQKKRGPAGEAEETIQDLKGVKLLVLKTEIDAKGLRDLSDQKIQKLGSGVALLGGVEGEKVSIILRVSKDLTGRFDAEKLLKEISTSVGGSGGGRPDMAQGGIPKEKWDEAALKLKSLIQ
ncbi:MAG: alanine--tRNA ligase [Deltaproteobacteria bacterium]|nr:alanine--tRNA ligase [Deltaproteobacteria bacterium]